MLKNLAQNKSIGAPIYTQTKMNFAHGIRIAKGDGELAASKP